VRTVKPKASATPTRPITDFRELGRENGAPASPENQPKRSDQLSKEFSHMKSPPNLGCFALFFSHLPLRTLTLDFGFAMSVIMDFLLSSSPASKGVPSQQALANEALDGNA
jgi:hypothetical protein